MRIGAVNGVPVEYAGVRYSSYTALATAFGLGPNCVAQRWKSGLRDERLVARRLYANKVRPPPKQVRR